MNSRPRFGLMKLTVLAALLFSTFITSQEVQANSSVNVDISIFHDALAPYGDWVNHQTYGQVWYPRDVARDWRPYTDGYWAHTDDYGWLWVSYEPWGWAPFHYGRWAWDNWYGWIWVPGRTWAPAWVFWRSGGGYAAWAPMPPNVVWQSGIGLNISYFNYERDLSWDSWVAVREYDLPHRHLNRRICPPHQNRQIINVTQYTNNVTIINNTIVNQGVPVKQIEEITHKPVARVVPKVHNRADMNIAGHQDGQPNIIRLPLAAPTPEEIHHNEELARHLDGKNPDGTRAELPVANSRHHGNQEPRLPGRYTGSPAPVQLPIAKPEQPNPLLKEKPEQVLPLPANLETPAVKHGHDSEMPRNRPEGHNNPEAPVPVQPSDQQSVPADDALMPPTQKQRNPLARAKKPDQNLVADQQQIEKSQAENLQRQKKIDSLQQELALGQEKQQKQEIEMQNQAERVTQEDRKIQQQDAVRQQEMQSQQQTELQQHQAERTRQEARQMQQQEVARQQEMQNQQERELQQQQAERTRQEARQMQQQEAARQQEMQNQQQLELQQQQAEQARQEARQMQQQEAARQQEIQNQQQMELQQQQAEHARQEVRQMQQQEAARQREIQNQQQMELQQHQAERTRQEAQRQETTRQREIQNQQQMELQQQQAERARQEARQMQQQEAARQQEMQNRQQRELQQHQAERTRQEARQMQQQEVARQQEIQNQQQMELQQQQAEQVRQEARQMQQQEAARQQEMQNQQERELQQQQAERTRQEAGQMQQQEAATPQRANQSWRETQSMRKQQRSGPVQ